MEEVFKLFERLASQEKLVYEHTETLSTDADLSKCFQILIDCLRCGVKTKAFATFYNKV